MGPIVNTSTGPADGLTGPGVCGSGALALAGANATANPHALGRCGYGPRLPLLVISPWARQNFVDHTVTDQSSVTRFIEDNFLGGQRLATGSFDALASPINQMFSFSKMRSNGILCLNPTTGERQQPILCQQ
jgi:phospholipase C